MSSKTPHQVVTILSPHVAQRILKFAERLRVGDTLTVQTHGEKIAIQFNKTREVMDAK